MPKIQTHAWLFALLVLGCTSQGGHSDNAASGPSTDKFTGTTGDGVTFRSYGGMEIQIYYGATQPIQFRFGGYARPPGGAEGGDMWGGTAVLTDEEALSAVVDMPVVGVQTHTLPGQAVVGRSGAYADGGTLHYERSSSTISGRVVTDDPRTSATFSGSWVAECWVPSEMLGGQPSTGGMTVDTNFVSPFCQKYVRLKNY